MATTKDTEDRLDVVEQMALKLKREVTTITRLPGPAGVPGPPGIRGPVGQPGKVGAVGPRGEQGLRGPAGADGARGDVGPEGAQGPVGPHGPRGEQGKVGPQGERGPKGEVGARGIQGQDGPQGLSGPRGLQGEIGPAGTDGRNGVDGRDGAPGLDGRDGERGPRGKDGEQGPVGPQGAPGADVPEDELRALKKKIAELEAKQKKYVFERPGGDPPPWAVVGLGGLRSPPQTAGVSAATSFEADCLGTDVVNHCVYITGAAVGGIAQVTRVDPKTTGLTVPAIGVITVKTGATRCTVTTLGIITVSPASLTPGLPHWVGTDGKPTSTIPVPDPASKVACQIIGTAIDAERLDVNPERRPSIRSSP